MKVLYSQSTATIKPYPRSDDNPILGLDPDYLVLEQVESPQPEYDPATETVREDWVIEDLEYRQGWIVESIPVAPFKDYPQFNLYLFSNADFIGYALTANTFNPLLVPGIIERYGRVEKEGLVESNFPFYWNVFCQMLNVSSEHRSEWGDVAQSFNLPIEFVNLIRG